MVPLKHLRTVVEMTTGINLNGYFFDNTDLDLEWFHLMAGMGHNLFSNTGMLLIDPYIEVTAGGGKELRGKPPPPAGIYTKSTVGKSHVM